MSKYSTPIDEILFVLSEFLNSKNLLKNFNNNDFDSIKSVIVECGKISENVLFPINSFGDEHHPEIKDNNVYAVASGEDTKNVQQEKA